MSEIADRYRTLAAELTRRIRAVPADAWSNPSPCEGWTARDVLRHVVEAQARPAGMAGLPPPSSTATVDDDPLLAWEEVRDYQQGLLDDPAVADIEFEGLGGTTTVARAVDLFICTDLLIHGWDIARATGQDETLPADEVSRVFEKAKAIEPMLRTSGACGPAVPVPDDAPEQDHLLGLFGRTP